MSKLLLYQMDTDEINEYVVIQGDVTIDPKEFEEPGYKLVAEIDLLDEPYAFPIDRILKVTSQLLGS